MPILKSINMPKVPWSCSNWCSGSLEDKVKFKERVQWTMFKRGMIIEKEKYGWESDSTTSPSDPSRSPSPTKRKPILLSASILDKFSITISESYWFLRIFTAHATIKLSPKLSSSSISYGGLLGTSWDQSIRTPWRCGYTRFPGRSGGFVPVTHIARECTAFCAVEL